MRGVSIRTILLVCLSVDKEGMRKMMVNEILKQQAKQQQLLLLLKKEKLLYEWGRERTASPSAPPTNFCTLVSHTTTTTHSPASQPLSVAVPTGRL
jgi:hypothetical protein